MISSKSLRRAKNQMVINQPFYSTVTESARNRSCSSSIQVVFCIEQSVNRNVSHYPQSKWTAHKKCWADTTLNWSIMFIHTPCNSEHSSEYFFNVTPKFDFLKAINLIFSFVWIYTSCYFGFYKPNFHHLKSYLTIQLNNYQKLLVVLLAYFY